MDWTFGGAMLELPPCATLASIRVDGHNDRVNLYNRSEWWYTVPFGRRFVQVEVRYRTEIGIGTFYTRLAQPAFVSKSAGIPATPSQAVPDTAVGDKVDEIVSELARPEIVLDGFDARTTVTHTWELPDGIEPLAGNAKAPEFVVVCPRSWTLAGVALALLAYLAARTSSRRWPLALCLASPRPGPSHYRHRWPTWPAGRSTPWHLPSRSTSSPSAQPPSSRLRYCSSALARPDAAGPTIRPST